MSTTHWKGGTIPTAGDDLLAAWPALLDTAGIITTASTPAAARVMLTAAAAAGAAITTTCPVYFDIQGIVYRADGTKTDNVWDLRPVNETGSWQGSRDTQSTVTITNTDTVKVITAELSIRPYDRMVSCIGMMTYTNASGTLYLATMRGSTVGPVARITEGSGMVYIPDQIRIPAGEDPDLHMILRGGGSGLTGTVTIAPYSDQTRFSVLEFPTSMA